jgi:Zn-dependent metalloprotease
MLRQIVINGTPEQREVALRSITISEQFRGQRGAMTKDILAYMKPVATEIKQRIVFDAQNGTQLPGTVVRQEGVAYDDEEQRPL